MPAVTLWVPEELYKRMKRYREVNWSRVFQDAVREYLAKREERKVTGF